jgi:hypothetical protein
VRYNVILPDQPLHIHIYTTSACRLYITNTRQRKSVRVDRVGPGLTNLATRYRLLGAGDLLIEEQAGWFVVSLPLVQENQLTSPSIS